MDPVAPGTHRPVDGVVVAMTAIGVVAAGALAWSLGTLAPSDVDPATADYMVEPLDVSSTVVALVGLAAAVAMVVVVVTVVRGARRSAARRAWLPVMGVLAAVAAYVGLTFAAVTAPVIGANIGGGMLVLLGLVLVPGGVIAAAVLTAKAARRR